MTKQPTVLQIKEAIVKNVCAPDETEFEVLSTSKIIRTSTKMEGDAELGMILLIGVSTLYGHDFEEISMLGSVEEEEFHFKLGKFSARLRQYSPQSRFVTKIRLIQNYLKLVYGISKVL